MAKNNNHPTIIKHGGDDHEDAHHGGAWKIAYADFMTAMMSFFLVMWLLNATTDEQRKGIAQFFNPMAERETHSQPTDSMLEAQPSPLTGGTSVKRIKDGETSTSPDTGQGAGSGSGEAAEQGVAGELARMAASNDITAGIRAQIATVRPSIVPIGGSGTGSAKNLGYIGADGATPADATQDQADTDQASAFQGDQPQTEQAQINKMTQGLEGAIQNNPDLRGASSNVSVKVGRDDIRIELRDADNAPMFDSGSAVPNSRGRKMLTEIANWLAPMPETLSIIGYTDAASYRSGKAWGMSNWTLSALRADHAREALVHAGYPDTKILDVSGRSDRDLAIASDPSAAGNRRVVLVMHRRFADPAADTAQPSVAAAPAPSVSQPQSQVQTPPGTNTQ
ncbi:MAG: flagellar motor protein MotB [Acetobacter sp.]|uniref:flagellar motor protein MotB n=1 Tax=Acetobacter sp. TaxID=440 RepID=UPI0039EB7E0C